MSSMNNDDSMRSVSSSDAETTVASIPTQDADTHQPKQETEGAAPSTTSEDDKKPLITEIRPGDVLFGRGRPFQMHPGNRRIHDMADQYKFQYAKMRNVDKRKITLAIVQCVQNDFNGRFLRPTNTMDSNNKACWKEVSDLEAQHKVRHTIRSRLRDDELKEAAVTTTKLQVGDDFKITFGDDDQKQFDRSQFFAEQMIPKADMNAPKKLVATTHHKMQTKQLPVKVKSSMGKMSKTGMEGDASMMIKMAMAKKMAMMNNTQPSMPTSGTSTNFTPMRSPTEMARMVSPASSPSASVRASSMQRIAMMERDALRRRAFLIQEANRDLLGHGPSEPHLNGMPESLPNSYAKPSSAFFRPNPMQMDAMRQSAMMSPEERMLRTQLARLQAEREAMAIARESIMFG